MVEKMLVLTFPFLQVNAHYQVKVLLANKQHLSFLQGVHNELSITFHDDDTKKNMLCCLCFFLSNFLCMCAKDPLLMHYICMITSLACSICSVQDNTWLGPIL